MIQNQIHPIRGDTSGSHPSPAARGEGEGKGMTCATNGEKKGEKGAGPHAAYNATDAPMATKRSRRVITARILGGWAGVKREPTLYSV